MAKAAWLTQAAKAFNVPTVITSVIAVRGGLVFPQFTHVFPDRKVIDRTTLDTWEDKRVVDIVKPTGRKQRLIVGVYTEICVAMPVIHALGEGWDVTVVTDACGGVSVEAHERTVKRMIHAGANVLTWLAVASRWLRDHARTQHIGAFVEVLK